MDSHWKTPNRRSWDCRATDPIREVNVPALNVKVGGSTPVRGAEAKNKWEQVVYSKLNQLSLAYGLVTELR